MIGRLPDFLCIGAMRCGTTYLWNAIAKHPDTYVAETKEIHFFDDYLGHWSRDVAWYSSFFTDALDSAMCGECTPSYLYAPGALERIKQVIPDAKLIVILRDPVVRAWSHHWFNVRAGREPMSFQDAIALEPERLATGTRDQILWYSYKARGKYIEQLERLESLFGRGQLFVTFLDDLTQDFYAVMLNLCKFLRIDSSSATLTYLVTTSATSSQNRGRYPVIRPIYMLTTRARQWGRGKPRAIEGCIRAVAGSVGRINVRRATKHMDPTVRRELEEYFAPYDDNLSRWLGREVPWR